MAEELQVINGDQEQIYESLLPQIFALIDGETDVIANMANIAAALKTQFSWFWVGFYIVKSNVLVLGPFQGPIACTRIAFGKGVCGACWQQKQTLIVPNVDEFIGHIACSSLAKSEIVVPIIRNNNVIAILDIDSEFLNYFNEMDKKYLEILVSKLYN